jgi:uncharacterized BrkB/YihY/UPF0761 family membrane protein
VVVAVFVGIGLQLLADGVAHAGDSGRIAWGAWLVGAAAGVAVYAVLIAIRRVLWPQRRKPRSPGKVQF